MNTELTAILNIVAAIEADTSNIFDNLSSRERVGLAAAIRETGATSDIATRISEILTIYHELDNEGYPQLSLYDKLIIACFAKKGMTGGNDTIDPVTAVAGVEALATLTFGGETDSDLAEGDTITVGAITLTAVANDATPADYEFCIDHDKETTAENVVAAFDAIPGVSVLPFTAAVDDATVVFTAKEAGVAGNLIEVSVETEGDTAFDDETFTGGVDEVEATEGFPGRVLVKDDNIYIKTESEYKQVSRNVFVVKKTIGNIGVTADYNFVTAANTTAQIIELEDVVPAFARILDLFTITNAAFTNLGDLTVNVGLTSGEDEFVAEGSLSPVNSIGQQAVGGSFAGAISASAQSIFVEATPENQWGSATPVGKMTVYVIYVDAVNV